jgi:hypothetical protein
MKLKELLPEIKLLKVKIKEELKNFIYNWDERGWEEAVERCYESNLPSDLKILLTKYTDIEVEIKNLLKKYCEEYNVKQDIF